MLMMRGFFGTRCAPETGVCLALRYHVYTKAGCRKRFWEIRCTPQRPADADDARLLLKASYTQIGLMLMMRVLCRTRCAYRGRLMLMMLRGFCWTRSL